MFLTEISECYSSTILLCWRFVTVGVCRTDVSHTNHLLSEDQEKRGTLSLLCLSTLFSCVCHSIDTSFDSGGSVTCKTQWHGVVRAFFQTTLTLCGGVLPSELKKSHDRLPVFSHDQFHIFLFLTRLFHNFFWRIFSRWKNFEDDLFDVIRWAVVSLELHVGWSANPYLCKMRRRWSHSSTLWK